MALNREKIVASAQKFMQRGQLDKAIKEFQRIVEEDPKDVRTLLKIGDLFSKKGERDNATQTYLKVAEFYSEQGFFLKAVAVYKQILKVTPSLIDVSIKLADLYGQLGLGSDALAQYQYVALYCEKAGQLSKTLQILRKMVVLDPANVGIRIKLAEMFAKENQNKEAIEEFREVARVLKEQNRTADYAKVGERILYLDPDNTALAKELAETYLKTNDVKRALAKLQVCFKADPRDASVLEMLANAFLTLGQMPKAVSVYRELAKIYADKGDYITRGQYLKSILALQPNDDEARSALEVKAPARGRANDTHAGGVRGSKPAPPPGPAPNTKLKPTEMIQKLLTETDVYVKYGLREKALEHLKKIFSLAPDNLEAHSKVRDIYLQAGDTDGAAATLMIMVAIGEREGKNDLVEGWLREVTNLVPGHADATEKLRAITPEEAEILDDDASADAPAEDDYDGGVELEIAIPRAAHEMPTFEELELETPEPPAPEEDEASDDEHADDIVDEDDDDAGVPDEAPAVSFTPSADLADAPPRVEAHGLELDMYLAALSVQSGEVERDPKPRIQSGESSLVRGAPPAVSVQMPALEETDRPEKEAHPAAAVEEDEPEDEGDVSDELEEADFFERQGLEDEAVEVYKNVLRKTLRNKVARAALTRLGAELPPELALPAKATLTKPAARTPPATPVAAKPALRPTPAPTSARQAAPAEKPVAEKPVAAPALVATKPVAPAPVKQAAVAPRAATLVAQKSAAPVVAAGAAAKRDLKVGGVTKSLINESALGGDAFDLASELADDFEGASSATFAAPEDLQFSVEDVLAEFKKGVSATVSDEDFATHYNLGIAYKEMGLSDEAVREFEISSRAKEKEVDSLSMIGICRMEQGAFKDAIDVLKRAATSDHLTPQQNVAVQYELARAYAGNGDEDLAHSLFGKVARLDPKFRDAAARAAGSAATAPAEDEGDAPSQPEKPTAGKKGKISYL